MPIPARPADPLPARHVPGHVAAARDGSQADDLVGRVPRPRRHPGRRRGALASRRARRRAADPPRVRLHQPGRSTPPATTAHILSTEGMVSYAERSKADSFLVATEVGILHRLEQKAPGKRFVPVNREAVCQYMKLITLAEAARLAPRRRPRDRRPGRRRRQGAPGPGADDRDLLRLGAGRARRPAFS